MPVKNFASFGAVPGTDVFAQCALVQQDIDATTEAYKLIVPSGTYYLSNTWEIKGDPGRTIVIEAEAGCGGAGGTLFCPDKAFNPVVELGTNYLPLLRDDGGLHDTFTTSHNPAWHVVPGYDPVDDRHWDYRPLVRLRAMGEGSALRGIAITGRDQNGVARVGKGLWVDGRWKNAMNTDNDSVAPVTGVFYGSNGLLIEACKVNNIYAVLEQPNPTLKPFEPDAAEPGKHFYPWLPATAIQVGLNSTDGATRQVSNVRISRSYVFGALGGESDYFPMRTDLGIYFGGGNMKNYSVTECNIGFCRYGIRTAGSGYTNVMSCDFAANGTDRAANGTYLANWPKGKDGADLLIPQANVNVVGCGSEGSTRFVQGDGAAASFGALNIDACYWDSDKLPRAAPGADFGYVIRNVNQATFVRGLRTLTLGGDPASDGAPKVAFQVYASKYLPHGLTIVNSHLDGISSVPLGDPLIYDASNNALIPGFETTAYAEMEIVPIVVQSCTSRGYTNGVPGEIVPLQNYDISSVKRLGGHAHKVTHVTAEKMRLSAWHHVIVANAAANDIDLLLPVSSSCRGREYIIKRMDDTPSAHQVTILHNSADPIDGSRAPILLGDLQSCWLVSTGTRGWVILGK